MAPGHVVLCASTRSLPRQNPQILALAERPKQGFLRLWAMHMEPGSLQEGDREL